ncbi:hypothetical protein Tco_0886290 [Tanacetum coccineum]
MVLLVIDRKSTNLPTTTLELHQTLVEQIRILLQELIEALVWDSVLYCKEYGHVARECQKPKRAKDVAYHKEKMLLSHYLYMEQIQKVTPDAANSSGPIFDAEPLQKDDQDDNDDLVKERDLLASLIEKLKCEIDDNKNRNKFLETSNKALVDKLKGEIENFKTKNKSLES